MKKAQNLIEVSLILVLVVAVSLALWPMFNNQKTKLADLSKSNVSTQSISGRQIQLKNNALDLASEMGLTINPNDNLQAILDKINQANMDKAKSLAKATGATFTDKANVDENLNTIELSAGTNSSEFAQITSYNEKYTALVKEQASLNATAITMNDNTTIAGAQGGRVSSNPVIKPTQSSVTKTSITGKYAYQPRPGQAPPKTDATGTTADSGIEESQYALKTKP